MSVFILLGCQLIFILAVYITYKFTLALILVYFLFNQYFKQIKHSFSIQETHLLGYEVPRIPGRVELKCITIQCGAPSATTVGTLGTLTLSAESSAILEQGMNLLFSNDD